MEKRAVHFIASRTKNYADKRELMNMVNELLGIQYNIAKANRTDRKVQNLAAYINADTLRAIHKTMDRKKAYGIDKVTKEDYEKNLEENLANLVKRMKNGSYRPNPTRRVYIPKETPFNKPTRQSNSVGVNACANKIADFSKRTSRLVFSSSSLDTFFIPME